MNSELAKRCSALVPRERSGHTAVVEENLLYVWGGCRVSATPSARIPSDEIWVLNLERGAWKMFTMTGQVPPTMSGACGCSLNGGMYIFGGYDFSGQTNEMYCVNLTDTKYTSRKIIHESGIVPSPRDKMSCWVYNGRIIYFGGYGEKTADDVRRRKDCFIVEEESWLLDLIWGWNNEVHIFDPTHASWSEPKTHGQAPSARAAHASATLAHRGYVIGGKVMETSTSDIHCLDLESWTWSKMYVCDYILHIFNGPHNQKGSKTDEKSSMIFEDQVSAVGRSWHTLTTVSDSSLFLFGGLSIDCKPMSDGWLFDVETKEWREVEHPHKDKPRLWHTACIGTDTDVIVFGGSCEYFLDVHKHQNDTLIFQMQPYPLYMICEDFIVKSVESNTALRTAVPLLPQQLLTAVQRKMSFDGPSTKLR